MNTYKMRLCFGILVVVVLAGCSMQAPLIVIVTPTPAPTTPAPAQPTAALPTAAAPTVKAATSAAAGVAQAASPTALPPTAIPATAAPPSAAPTLPFTATALPTMTRTGSETPTATFGSIVGPGYQSPTPVSPTPITPTPITITVVPPTLAPTTPGPSPTPLPVLQKSLMGIQIHGYLNENDWFGMITRSQQLGVGWIKVQVQWKEMEPSPGNFNQVYQGLVLDLQHVSSNYHFKVLLSVAKAPDWARGPGQHTDDGPPTDPQALADFMTRMVHDIKPEFIDAIEIWNEPNLIREWSGAALNAATYIKYFDAGYKAIRAEEQHEPASDPKHRIAILAAAPAAGAPDSPTSVQDRNWIRQLYAAGFAHYGTDVGLSAHPYGWANAPDATCCTAPPGITGWYDNRGFFFKDTLDDYRKIMTDNHHDGAKLWVTEFGWATYDGLHRTDGSAASAPGDSSFGWIKLINQQQQAAYVVRAYSLVQHPPYSDFIGPMMLWNLNFGTIPTMIDQGREEAGFSLLDVNGTPRPVFIALANAPKQ